MLRSPLFGIGNHQPIHNRTGKHTFLNCEWVLSIPILSSCHRQPPLTVGPRSYPITRIASILAKNLYQIYLSRHMRPLSSGQSLRWTLILARESTLAFDGKLETYLPGQAPFFLQSKLNRTYSIMGRCDDIVTGAIWVIQCLATTFGEGVKELLCKPGLGMANCHLRDQCSILRSF